MRRSVILRKEKFTMFMAKRALEKMNKEVEEVAVIKTFLNNSLEEAAVFIINMEEISVKNMQTFLRIQM